MNPRGGGVREGGYSRSQSSDMLYGLVMTRAKNKNVFVVTTKHGKFLITTGSRVYAGSMARIGDLIEFNASPQTKKDSDVTGIVEEYQIIDPLPPMFRSAVTYNDAGTPIIKLSCEVVYRHRKDGINIFENEWLGDVLDVKGRIQSPRVNEPYQCSLKRAFQFEGTPDGAWLITYVQYEPIASLNPPNVGFLFSRRTSSERQNFFIWYQKLAKVLFVSYDQMSAFGFENAGNWVNFYTCPSGQVKRLAPLRDLRTKTVVREDGKCMCTLSCEFHGDSKNGYAVWQNEMTGKVFDKLHITQPVTGDRGVFWCFLDLHDSGNEEWVIESVKEVESVEEQEMERVHTYERDEERRYERVHDHPRRQRNERVDEEERVSRNESRQRNERGEEMDRVSRNERIESRQSHRRVEEVDRRQRKRSERVEEREYREEREHRHEDHSINGINGNMRRMSIGSAHSLPMTPRSVQASLPHDNSFDDEGGSSLADICHQLFRLNSVRQVALKSDPILYAQLMERLNGFGSGRND